MKVHDLSHSDGSRSIQIRTYCGFEITLMRTVEGLLKQACYFNHQPVSFINTQYRLSKAGAYEYSETIKEIFSHART